MRERLIVISHHEEIIRKYYANITDLEEAKQKVRAESLKAALKSKSGRNAGYPKLKYGSSAVREKFVESVAKLVVAVNTGNFNPKPDLSESGIYCDIWCKSCGNLEETPDGKYKCSG